MSLKTFQPSNNPSSGAIPPAPVVPAITSIYARLKRVQEHSSAVNTRHRKQHAWTSGLRAIGSSLPISPVLHLEYPPGTASQSSPNAAASTRRRVRLSHSRVSLDSEFTQASLLCLHVSLSRASTCQASSSTDAREDEEAYEVGVVVRHCA